jgi:predicted metal-dependent phosphoesterase TrpH
MWIKADLHIHSSASYDCRTEAWAIVATCLRRGLGAFAIADHNALDGSRAAAELVASYEFADFMERHYSGRPPPRVVVAQEINTRDGEAMGMFISRPLTRGLSLAETIIEIHEQGGLVNIPHPFTRIAHRRPRLEFMERFADDIDVVEVYNARNFYIQDDRLALDFARRHNLGRSAGSDAHFRNEIGRGYVLIKDFDGRDSFLESSKAAVPAGRKTPPAVPLVNWLRNFPGAWADMRLQYRLTGRP